MAHEPKISRKDLHLKQPDQFQVLNARFMELCLKNQGTLIIFALMLITVGTGFWFYSQWQKTEDLKMETQYFELDKLRIQMEKETNPALLKKMQEMLPAFSEGPPKIRARLLLADIHYREHRYDESIVLYREVISKISPEDINYNVARSGLAHSLEGKKEYKEAIENYKLVVVSLWHI